MCFMQGHAPQFWRACPADWQIILQFSLKMMRILWSNQSGPLPHVVLCHNEGHILQLGKSLFGVDRHHGGQVRQFGLCGQDDESSLVPNPRATSSG